MSINTEEYLMPYLASFDRVRNTAHFHGCHALPKMSEVKLIADSLSNLFYPGLDDRDKNSTLEDSVKRNLKDVTERLEKAICLSYAYEGMCESDAKAATDKALKNLLERLPAIRRMLKKDAEAGFRGDPAARNLHEIILCYPAIKALSVHRVAHQLFISGVPLIPRMLNETVHGETGIDIHPGASIGESFFIDHGTGVVIGETTVIGNNVKLYQGVTLGALSFPKDGCGMLIRGAKRHPTIKDHVTIYANATVLGDITIGEHSIIGSSAWIKTNIAPWSRVLIPDPEIIVTERKVREVKP